MIGCADVQAALSARLDGEDAGVSDDVVDAHLSGCVDCRAFFEQAARLKRALNFGPAESRLAEVPDLSEIILTEVEPVRRRRAASRALGVALSRVVLVLLGVLLLVWAYRLVGESAQSTPLGGVDTDTSSLLIDAAAIRLALACGLFLSAWRPRLSMALMPVYGAYAAFSCGFATREVVLGFASTQDVLGLAVLGCSALALLCTWLVGFGLTGISHAWRTATARPY